MKVNVDGKTYVVHFVTKSHQAKFGPVSDCFGSTKELTDIECVVRRIYESGEKIEICRGEAHQNFRDPCNHVIGRKIAFTNAVKGFCRSDRKIFWEEYKKCSRI